MATKTRFVACMVFALGGCDAVEDEVEGFADDGAIQARKLNWNGVDLNGYKLNTFRINSFRINTSKLYGNTKSEYIEFFDIYLSDGGYAYDASLTGGRLKVGAFTGYDVMWSEFDFIVRENGQSSWKYVFVRDADPLVGSSDVWEYELELREGTGGYEDLCVDIHGNPTRALMLADVWNPETGAKIVPRPTGAMTFACKDGALAKCVMFGYRPWEAKNGIALADYHQACTRMVRADYCGTGTPHTVTGTPVHVLDQLGIQNVDASAEYVLEAEWGPNGAVCLNADNTRLSNQTIECNIPACGESFASGGLIQSGKLVL